MSKDDNQPSGFGQFIAEMRRRHVVRFSIGYAAAAFVVLQLAEIVFPAFDIGETGLRILVVAVALLFPPAVVLAWIFDITSEGIKRTEDLPDGRTGRRPGRLIPRVALLGFTLVVVGSVALWLARADFLEQAPRPVRRGRPAPELVAYDPSAPIRSLAVLPLQNFSESGEQDYFSAGMHEELIAQLSQISGLRVVSRTSVMRFADTDTPIPAIGRDLQVDAVIEGSIRREGQEVRITIQLIQAASDTHIWTQQYDRSLDDVLALQSEVALDIAHQIQAEVDPEENTILRKTASREVAPQAQDAYLRGKFEYEKGTQAGYQAALDHFQEAVREDSTFAPALAGLAGTRFLLGMSDPDTSAASLEQARSEAEKALAMDTLSVEARDVVTLIRSALPALRTAERSAPPAQPSTPAVAQRPATGVRDVSGVATVDLSDLDTAWVAAMSQLGRHIEARMRQAASTSERQSRIQRVVGARQLMAAGMFSDAVGMLSGVVDQAPDFGPAWELLARAQVASGNPQGAVGAMEGWSARGGEDAPTDAEVQALQTAVSRDGARGYWQWTQRRLDARRAEGKEISWTEYAASQSALGDVEAALASLEQALERHERALATLHSDPVWDNLRGDPRFGEILRSAEALRVPSFRHDAGDRRR